MNKKELTKTFMIISNWKNPLISMVYTKVFQHFKGQFDWIMPNLTRNWFFFFIFSLQAEHVINYDFPSFMSDYIHRAGRVGRVGSSPSSMAISFVAHKWEVDLLWKIEVCSKSMSSCCSCSCVRSLSDELSLMTNAVSLLPHHIRCWSNSWCLTFAGYIQFQITKL